MPTSLETIASQNLADVYAALTVDTETGTLRAELSGPEGGFGIDIDPFAILADGPPAALDTIDRRLKAWADAIDALRIAIVGGTALDYFPAPAD